MLKFGKTLVIATVAIAAACTAEAGVIASFTHHDSGGYGEIVSDLEIELAYDAPRAAIEGVGGSVGVAEIGQTFEMSSKNKAAFIARLTDGIDDMLYIDLAGFGQLESQWFAGIPGLSGPDLMGFDITRIEFRLDHISFDAPGSDPNGNGQWTDFRVSLTFNFHGVAPQQIEVPGPGGLGLLGLGLLGLAAIRQRRSA